MIKKLLLITMATSVAMPVQAMSFNPKSIVSNFSSAAAMSLAVVSPLIYEGVTTYLDAQMDLSGKYGSESDKQEAMPKRLIQAGIFTGITAMQAFSHWIKKKPVKNIAGINKSWQLTAGCALDACYPGLIALGAIHASYGENNIKDAILSTNFKSAGMSLAVMASAFFGVKYISLKLKESGINDNVMQTLRNWEKVDKAVFNRSVHQEVLRRMNELAQEAAITHIGYLPKNLMEEAKGYLTSLGFDETFSGLCK